MGRRRVIVRGVDGGMIVKFLWVFISGTVVGDEMRWDEKEMLILMLLLLEKGNLAIDR